MKLSVHLSFCLLFGRSIAQDVQRNSSKTPCTSLCNVFPNQVSYRGSASYNTTDSQFWDQACILSPTCIFYPTSAKDVSVALKLLRSMNGLFAVKSGGHLSIPGYNNINDGVLVSMEKMKTMKWKEGHTVLELSAGVLWGEVYDEAAGMGKVVVGGRIPGIGVSGFLLGGGLSFIGGQYGFGCDNVVGFEVVLANGDIVYATPSKYPDLYKALKGGSSNYGIVTRFDVSAYPAVGGWGGQQIIPIDSNATREKMLDVIADFHMNGALDNKTGAIASIVTWPEVGLKAFLGNLFYSGKVPTNSTPEAFSGFVSLGGTSGLYSGKVPTNSTPEAFSGFVSLGGSSGLGNITLSGIVAVTGTGTMKGAARNTFHVGSVVATRESIKKVDEIFHAEFAKISDVAGLRTVIVFQAIPPSFVYAGNKNGGNPMGLDASRGTVSWVSQSVRWINAEDEYRVKLAQRNAKNAYMAWAWENGLGDEFLYLNDADEFQDVFGSYGSGNVNFLKAVKSKYDPESVFEKLMPGGYKV